MYSKDVKRCVSVRLPHVKYELIVESTDTMSDSKPIHFVAIDSYSPKSEFEPMERVPATVESVMTGISINVDRRLNNF